MPEHFATLFLICPMTILTSSSIICIGFAYQPGASSTRILLFSTSLSAGALIFSNLAHTHGMPMLGLTLISFSLCMLTFLLAMLEMMDQITVFTENDPPNNGIPLPWQGDFSCPQ